jgi:hypothetical protein
MKASTAKILAPGTKALNEIDFSSIDLNEDEMLLRCSSVNALARTPSAKFDQIKELQELMGDEFRPEWVLTALNMGDAEKWEDEMAAYTELAVWQIDRALEDGKYEPPETGPVEYLETVVKLGTRELMSARKYTDIDGDNLDQLRKLIATAQHFIEKSAPPPAPVPPVQDPTAAAQTPVG